MSRDRNNAAKFLLGGCCLLAVAIVPIPGPQAARRPLHVGDSVFYESDPAARHWRVEGFNRVGDTAVIQSGDERAIVAVWECRRID